MSDQPSSEPPPSAPPSVDIAPERVRVRPSARRGAPWQALAYLAGFVVLAGALIYLVRHPAVQPALTNGLARAEDQIGDLRAQVEALSGRVGQVEARPQPSPPPSVDLKPLEGRIAALEARPLPAAPTPAPPPLDLRPLEAKVAALEARPQPAPTNLKPLEDRVAALEARPQPPPAASPADLAALSGRLDQVASKQDALAGRLGTETAAVGARLDKVEARLAAAEQAASEVAGLSGTAKRLGRLQAASAALDEGQPLGAIPGAPPALARFANQPPPTLGALRLGFPAAADAAHEASQPAITENQPFLDRLWTRAQQAVTVREGTRVVLGDPIAGVLAKARQRLDAGDLAGAVQALDGLAGPAAAAMKPWRDQAQALLDARAALAKLAADAEG